MGEQTQTPHLSLWGVGSLPTLPRAVPDLWSQVPAGFDFLGERLSDRDQDPGELPVWRGGGEGSGRKGQGERMKPPRTRSLPTSGSRGVWSPVASRALPPSCCLQKGHCQCSAPLLALRTGRAEAPAQGPLEASTSPAAGAGSGSDSRGAYRGVREAVTEWAGVAGMPGTRGRLGPAETQWVSEGQGQALGKGETQTGPAKRQGQKCTTDTQNLRRPD